MEEYFEEHIENDEYCINCWTNYPVKCNCGGLIHAHFGDYCGDGDDYGFYLEKCCDKCGFSFEEEEED